MCLEILSYIIIADTLDLKVGIWIDRTEKLFTLVMVFGGMSPV